MPLTRKKQQTTQKVNPKTKRRCDKNGSKSEQNNLESNNNPMLPPLSLFPLHTDSHSQQQSDLNNLKSALLLIIGKIMNKVQNDDDNLTSNYELIENLYEYADQVVNDLKFVSRYRNLVVGCLWQFGAVVWKHVGGGSKSNKFAERVSRFLTHCFLRLGWNKSDWKQPKIQPACYCVVKLFVKNHNDRSTQIRAAQLKLISQIATQAHASNQTDFLAFLFTTAYTCLQIRLKDKSNQCRALTVQIMSKLIELEDAQTMVLKQLKFFTRYDPCVEVRKLGTIAIGKNERTRIRFFYDQAFDKNASVRAEAFRVMGLLKNDGLLRDMSELNADKLCKVIVWGLVYSDAKCSGILKNEVLPNWLTRSCDNSLIRFLTNLDAYDNMRAVLRILDLLLTEQQQAFVEQLDLSFINDIKQNVVAKNYRLVTIEAMVGWLSLCKASEKIDSIRYRVIPSCDEMMMLLQCLHDCAFLEHDASQLEDRAEDVSPILCAVLAMEICKFVVWEEGGRRSLQKLLKEMLLDPVMDERVLIVQAMNKIHSFVSAQDFEDIMMSVFQDVFDARNKFDRQKTKTEERRRLVDRSETAEVMEVVERMTSYQMSKLREKLCDLALTRYNLQRRKEELIAQKKFMDTIPINNEIMAIQKEETELNAKLKLQEELAKTPAAAALSDSLVVEPPMSQPVEPMELEEDDDDDTNQTGVINSVEEGLAKGIFMINTYLDLCPGMNAFFRNFYENYAPSFITSEDITVRIATIQFLTRVALNDQRELKKITNMLLLLLLGETEAPLKNVAFKGIVDLLVCYEYSEFLLTNEEKQQNDFSVNTMKRDYTTHLMLVVDQRLTYESADQSHMEALFIKALTSHFPPSQSCLKPEEILLLLTTKHQGLLKLLVRGRLRDSSAIAKLLMLWVNHDYAGTAVLRDLEHVLKLYSTFDWWGNGKADGLLEEEEDEEEHDELSLVGNERERLLGLAVGEACVALCQEGKGVDEDHGVVKFVAYMVGFLDTRDQALMRSIVCTILSPVESHPTRSYNNSLVRAAAYIPLISLKSGKTLVRIIDNIFKNMRDLPLTTSMTTLRRELNGLLRKLKNVHGNDVLVIQEAQGKTRMVGKDFIWGEEFVEQNSSDDDNVNEVQMFSDEDE